MKYFLALLACLSFSTAAIAKGPEKYIFDPAHTQIEFRVDHLGFSHPSGRFLKFTGGFTFDQNAVEGSTVAISIDPASIDMGSPEWERVMKSETFLDVKTYKEIRFQSLKIEKTGAKTGRLTGNLSLHGVTKPVTLDVRYNKSGTHPYNKNYIAGFDAHGTIKRSDFGMKFGLPGIGDEVEVWIQVEGIRQDFSQLDKK